MFCSVGSVLSDFFHHEVNNLNQSHNPILSSPPLLVMCSDDTCMRDA
jgi:hypothetical protein